MFHLFHRKRQSHRHPKTELRQFAFECCENRILLSGDGVIPLGNLFDVKLDGIYFRLSQPMSHDVGLIPQGHKPAFLSGTITFTDQSQYWLDMDSIALNAITRGDATTNNALKSIIPNEEFHPIDPFAIEKPASDPPYFADPPHRMAPPQPPGPRIAEFELETGPEKESEKGFETDKIIAWGAQLRLIDQARESRSVLSDSGFTSASVAPDVWSEAWASTGSNPNEEFERVSEGPTHNLSKTLEEIHLEREWAFEISYTTPLPSGTQPEMVASPPRNTPAESTQDIFNAELNPRLSAANAASDQTTVESELLVELNSWEDSTAHLQLAEFRDATKPRDAIFAGLFSKNQVKHFAIAGAMLSVLAMSHVESVSRPLAEPKTRDGDPRPNHRRQQQ